MPDVPFVDPPVVLINAQQVTIITESLQRAILVRMNLLSSPKPTYEIDGQTFKWNEYLDVLNKTIKQLQTDLVALDEDYEIESSMYSA